MKKLLVPAIALAMAACSSQQLTPAQQYVAACGTYATAFSTMVQLREAGQLTPQAINAVTVADTLVSPMCTPPLPANPTAAMVAQIATAVAALQPYAPIAPAIPAASTTAPTAQVTK